MATTYPLLVITPEGAMLDEQVVMTVAPGVEGELGVLAGHIPLMTTLNPGEVRVTLADGQSTSHVFVGGGLLEVSSEGVVVLADSAERIDEIDVNRAEADLSAAEKMLAELPPESAEAQQARQSAAVAQARIRAGRASR